MNKTPEQHSTIAIDEEQRAPTEPLTQTMIPSETAAERNCPKCTGPMIKCQVGHVAIYGWWLERELRSAGVLGPPRTVSSDVTARTCIRCGYTELYATDPAALLSGNDLN